MNKMLKTNMILSAVLLLLTACSGQSPQPLATAVPLSATSAPPVSTATSEQAPTPAAACSPAAPTVAMTEGPYFTPNSPEQAILFEAGMSGTKLVLSGYVLTTECQSVAGALLDFWQANADGHYDNTGYTLRGHQFTDTTGHYQLTTVIPGLYPGRTEHIHVKVQAPNGPILTTQLFFPGVADNETDGIFDSTLLISIQDTDEGVLGTYHFIVNTP